MTIFIANKAVSLAAISATVIGGYVSIASVPQARAQSASIALEEITVTARRREESLMQVPMSISAFSEADIEDRGIKDVFDLELYTPSLRVTGAGGGRSDRSNNSLTFRGLSLTRNFGATAGGQLFLDGAPVIGAQAPAVADIARIEVLKGPQSAYFGRSTFSGAINFITRDPGNEFKGKFTGEYASFDSTEAILSVEGPLVEDKLALRVAGTYLHRGGQYTNTAEISQRFGRQDTTSLSGILVATPNDDLKIKAFVSWFENDDGPPALVNLKTIDDLGSTNCVFPGGRGNGGYFCGAIPNSDELSPNTISANYTLDEYFSSRLIDNSTNQPVIFDPSFIDHGGLRRVALQSSLQINYQTQGGYDINALTAYHSDKNSVITDLNYRDGRDVPNPFSFIPGTLPYYAFTLVVQNKQRDFSQELRVTSPQDQALRWTVGGNYLDVSSPGGSVYGVFPAGTGFFGSITENEVKTPSVFGGFYYDVIEDLTLSVDARYQWDKIKASPIVGSNGQPVTGLAAIPLEETFKSFSPRVSLDYKYADNSTVYALWARGYRPGGFNGVLATSPPSVVQQFAAAGAEIAYEEEQLDNYEVGIKSTWLDGRARTSLSVYYQKWKKGQVGSSIPFFNPDGTPNISTVVVNTGTADLKGFEFEGEFQATEKLNLSATMALNDTKLKTFTCGDCNLITGSLDGSGKQMPGVARWTGTMSAQYTDRLTGDYNWFGRADYSYRSKYFVDFSNVAWATPAHVVNLRIGVENGQVSLEAFVKNLTQESSPKQAVFGVDLFTLLTGAQNAIAYGLADKRQFGVRGTYNF